MTITEHDFLGWFLPQNLRVVKLCGSLNVISNLDSISCKKY
jgi:hypothetical protein